MKHNLTEEEIVKYFTTTKAEISFIDSKPLNNRLRLLSYLKYYEHTGRFPATQYSLPKSAVEYLAEQLGTSLATYYDNSFTARTIQRYKKQVREFLNYNKCLDEHMDKLRAWLVSEIFPQHTKFNHIKDLTYKFFREQEIEPPPQNKLESIIISTLNQWEEAIIKNISDSLPNATKGHIDKLLLGDEDGSNFRTLKRAPGDVSLASILGELHKLRIIKSFDINPEIFLGLRNETLKKYRDRIITEPAREVRRHPDDIRYGLFAIFLYILGRETSDTVCDYLIRIVKRINKGSEKRVIKKAINNINNIENKDGLICKILTTIIENPDKVVKDVVFPIATQETIQALINDYKKTPSYTISLNRSMKASYGSHYRRMLAGLIDVIEFDSKNVAYKPILEAVKVIKKYLGHKSQYYAKEETVPVDGALHEDFKKFIYRDDDKGSKRINRVAYELGVLKNIADKLSHKGIWAKSSDRYRDPDKDTPADFELNRDIYYAKLRLTKNEDHFVESLQKEMDAELNRLDKDIPFNQYVKILKQDGGRIKLSPCEKQPEPKHITWLKDEISKKWNVINLLDVLKETDLRIDFTRHFKTRGQRQIVSTKKLRKRLILDLYAMGTNAGISRIASGNHGEEYTDLVYVKRRYISKEAIRLAITDVVNKILEDRRPDIFGETTTTCAGDSTQFRAWDQNLITEWHLRYGGRGIMIYWHVEKGASCIYSQLKSCSSSEVASMIEGVMRHCTAMEIDKQYVDTHGQSYVAFAFCHLLGFNLLPRFRSMDSKKLYRPYAGLKGAYGNLQPVLTRPINWKLIKSQYDEIVKFTTAIKEGTASAEAILKRFTKSNSSHPTYQGLLELGKAVRTIFLCRYLYSKDLRIEIHEGLNVVELWNDFNDLIFFGKCGEISSNRRESHEYSMLCLHLLQNCLVYINTLMIQEILNSPGNLQKMTIEDLRALTPLIFRHINPYGNFDLDMDRRIPFIRFYNRAA
jgi:TnpA family transposase